MARPLLLAWLPFALATACTFDLPDVAGSAGSLAGSTTTGAAGGSDTTSSGGGGSATSGGTSATGGGAGSTITATGGGGAGGGATGGGGAGGTGGVAPEVIGCSDGEREAYDLMAFPAIAACAGGFSIPGLSMAAATPASCNRISGDDSINPSGQGCSAEDLCAAGWHVCKSSEDVDLHTAGAGCPSLVGQIVHYSTRQTMNVDTQVVCADPLTNSNNLVGCGSTLGQAPDNGDNCQPLDAIVKNTHCSTSVAWKCDSTNNEADVVTKTGPEEGGVLCCRDAL